MDASRQQEKGASNPTLAAAGSERADSPDRWPVILSAPTQIQGVAHVHCH
jgi:hypothetical protein